MTAAAEQRAALAGLVAGVDELVSMLKSTGRAPGCFEVKGMAAARAALKQTDGAGSAGGATLNVGGFYATGDAAELATVVVERVVVPVLAQVIRSSGQADGAQFLSRMLGCIAGTMLQTAGAAMAVSVAGVVLEELKALEAPASRGVH